MPIDLSRLRPLFFRESSEHINNMEEALLALETAPADAELLNSIFRAAHSIKGGSGTFAFDDITRFTHVLEEVLDRMRQQLIEPTPERNQLLLRACDVLRGLLAAAESGSAPPAEMEEVLAGLTVAQRAGNFSLNAPYQLRAKDKKPQSLTVYSIRFVPSPTIFREGMDPLLVLRDLTELGEIEGITADLSQLPALSELNPDICCLAWDIRLSTGRERAEIADVFAFVEDGAQITIEAQPQAGIAESGKASTNPVVQPVSGANERRPAIRSDAIRVATAKVDQLVDLVGELVIAQSMAMEVANHFTPERLSALQTALAEVGRNTRQLQERVMAVRMLPVATIFARLPRIVHDIAAASGKSIHIEFSGEDTALDKSVLEGMMDPLTHLVRNSADHGIESVEKRRAVGKPEQGTIRLNARHENGNFVIEVSDDGRGLNLARIREKAIERGLLSASEEPGPEQLQALIFQPGFSTAEKVSEVSGRGVGMDVVRRNVESMGGVISLKTREGLGTTVLVKLPLTLAILDGQLVRVGNQTYVLPLLSIVESIQPRREQVCVVAGEGEAVMVRHQPIPLLRLHRLFGIPTDVVEPSRGLVAVVEHENRQLALLIDELLGQQQVVIKNLQSNFRKVEGTMGATILGDGQVTLILDVAGLVELSRKNGGKFQSVPGKLQSSSVPAVPSFSAPISALRSGEFSALKPQGEPAAGPRGSAVVTHCAN